VVLKNLSVKRDHVGDWFMTITADMQKDYSADVRADNIGQSCPDFTSPIGIDPGMKALITTSDGVQVDPPKLLMESEKKLKRAQKDLSRKMKGSENSVKAKKRVAKVHRKIQRQRDDFSHKISNSLVEKLMISLFLRI
jgi:putative transposase